MRTWADTLDFIPTMQLRRPLSVNGHRVLDLRQMICLCAFIVRVHKPHHEETQLILLIICNKTNTVSSIIAIYFMET